jgi:phosphonate transport system substrate-binding protein
LAATRGGLNNDSTNPVDWNNNKPTTSDPTNQVAYYKGLIVAGTTTAARTVADKVNAGGTLVWNDVKDLTWCIQSSTSSSGYIYPDIWLEDNFGKTYDDLTHATVNPGGYGGAIADLASGTCDVATMYADARRDYADDWTGTYGMSDSIWNMTDVIGVTKNIMNDTISVSTVNLTADQITDIQQAYLALAQLQVGKDIEAVYSHEGYVIVTDSDYNGARQAAALTAGQ